MVWFQVRAISCHRISSKSAWKSAPKCTWMCWRVWWSPGAIRWPVADPGCGSRTWRRPTSPKRLGFRRSAPTLYPSLTGSLFPPVSWYFRMHWLHLCRGVRPHPIKGCSGYDVKQSDRVVPALEIWEIWSTPSLKFELAYFNVSVQFFY